MSILDFLVAINGVGQLWAADGQFLGLLSSNRYDLNSINNPYGVYGSQNGLYSIRNSCGMYGSQNGLYSPYNAYCLNPPIIFYQEQPVMIVTKNVYAQTNGLPVFDPDSLLGVFAQITSSTPTVDIVQVQLELLSQASQTNAQAINQAMISAAQFF